MSSERDNFMAVPVLEPDSSNWVIWKNHLYYVMVTKGTYEHLIGTTIHLTPPNPTETWDKAKVTTQWQLTCAMKDVTFHLIMGKALVSEMWAEITKEFEALEQGCQSSKLFTMH